MAVKGGGGRPDGGGLYRGLVLLTRQPGEFTLSGVDASVAGIDRPLFIRRKVPTRAGTIVVLGLMHFQRDPSAREGYRAVAFDNREETLDYLRRTYPDLVAGPAAPEVTLAPGDYQPMQKLVELRAAYARAEAKAAKRQGRFWLAAPAGTIAEVAVAGDSVEVLRFLPPVTYHEPMLNAWDANGALVFSSSTHRWRIVDGRVEAIPPASDKGGR